MKCRALALSEIGKRERNEDSIFPFFDNAIEHENVFILCDGVGGGKYGDVASRLASYSLYERIKIFKYDIIDAVRYTERQFDTYISLHSESLGMSTTAVIVDFCENTCKIGWVGDSRVYHIRNGHILYRTQDHSLVNKLVEIGKLTEREAKHHWLKTYVLQCIKGTSNHCEIGIKEISGIKSKDFFLICSDGILEAVDDEILSLLFINNNTLEYILREIKYICRCSSKDNYSMFIIEIL
ncbi:PP2C family protein-serine/threonine phosphatase [Larkinella sp.]|uniref:PP2C family protein-serine/threonine phosphatase n=1 Tax=Larkinella sp. TaxID=2034517 RepID=UPI003BA95008